MRTQKQLESCFSFYSAYLSSKILFELFILVFYSISVHKLYLYKSCIFQSLEITPSSYCHHVLPLEQVCFGYDAVMFPQQKQCCLPALCLCTPLLLSLLSKCALTTADTGQLARRSLGSFASKLGKCGYYPLLLSVHSQLWLLFTLLLHCCAVKGSGRPHRGNSNF